MRGVALFGDKVFFALGEAVLVAIDARTGREVWATTIEDNQNGYCTTMAPLIADGKVLIGASGGEFGIRGFIAAFEPNSGKEIWRVYTVPAPGPPGSETWPKSDQWKNGGGPVWVTPNYDPDSNLAFVGVGNGGPWMGDRRPGDNLYTASTIAVDVAKGQIKGHFQYNPNESWDWDEVSPPLLVDFKRGDRSYKGLIDVARDGYVWFLERSAGEFHFVEGKPFVRQNVFEGLNPTPGRGYTGSGYQIFLLPGADHVGEVQAWDVDTGKKVWTHMYPKSPNWGPMLATAGGLVFTGGANDRLFHAFDAKSGKLLWQFPTDSGIVGQPTSFEVDGKQYVAVLAGWGGDAVGIQGVLNESRPNQSPEVPQAGSVWVFGVK
jgi:alcohol dehydrogenase (cytochrome c)